MTGITFQGHTSVNPKLLNSNQAHPSKKLIFWSNSYKMVVVIVPLIKMREIPNFGHINTSTESRGKILLVMLWTKIMRSLPLFQNSFIVRGPRVANFTDINLYDAYKYHL